jgi:hypothetical protein
MIKRWGLERERERDVKSSKRTVVIREVHNGLIYAGRELRKEGVVVVVCKKLLGPTKRKKTQKCGARNEYKYSLDLVHAPMLVVWGRVWITNETNYYNYNYAIMDILLLLKFYIILFISN